MTESRRWKLAGLSVGGSASAVAAIAAHQLARSIFASSGEPGHWWVPVVVGLGMSLCGLGGLFFGYRITLRHGAKLVRQGRERPLHAFVLGVTPWLAMGLWIISVALL